GLALICGAYCSGFGVLGSGIRMHPAPCALSPVLNSSSLRRAATVVRHRGHVADARHFEAGSLKGADRCLASGAGTANQDFDAAKAVLLSDSARLLSSNLRGERSALAAALKVHVA